MRTKLGNVRSAVERTVWRAGYVLKGQSGEGFVDTAIKILIPVVIGALLLAGLYALFNDSILPELQNRIQQMFSYSG
ncbi:DUF6133 family protein [Enterocloster citroniae]|uniref:DUF6133 family protein n=1 Tax=Enterocloster citroniae TaxID=358743 RepID=UPI0008ED101F|nr:DUF6133 family protein [Enterocloster citroniae]SFS19103.1 hypothetical protein SAMN05216568_105230 [Enterocloster citroniae]